LRERKAAVAQSRLLGGIGDENSGGAEGEGHGGAAATPEQVTSGRATQVPDQNEASGYGAATPPTSFSDGSCFFDGAGGFFDSSSMSQPWMLNSNPATWY